MSLHRVTTGPRVQSIRDASCGARGPLNASACGGLALVTYKQLGAAVALALFVPAVVAGGSTASTEDVSTVAGHTGYVHLVSERETEPSGPRLLGYFECQVSTFGVTFTPEGALKEWLCPENPYIWITPNDGSDPRGRVRTPTGITIELPSPDGSPVPPVREFIYWDDAGKVRHVWGVEVGETRFDPQTGRPYNFVGSVDVTKVPAGTGLRAWTETA